MATVAFSRDTCGIDLVRNVYGSWRIDRYLDLITIFVTCFSCCFFFIYFMFLLLMFSPESRHRFLTRRCPSRSIGTGAESARRSHPRGDWCLLQLSRHGPAIGSSSCLATSGPSRFLPYFVNMKIRRECLITFSAIDNFITAITIVPVAIFSF